MDPNPSLDTINHFINRDEARKLIGTYREMQSELLNPSFQGFQKEYGVLPTWEAFNEKSILSILAQPGCVGIRIHYGLKQQETERGIVPLIVSVLVGVASDGSDMWGAAAVTSPTQTALSMGTTSRGEDEGVILEDSQRCPPFGNEGRLP